MERNLVKKMKEELRIAGIALGFSDKAKEISKEANIAAVLGLTSDQMKVFDASFAFYLQQKIGQPSSKALNKIELNSGNWINNIGVSANYSWLNRAAEIEDRVSDILEKEMQIVKERADHNLSPRPQAIQNVANFLSTKYVENPNNFNEQVPSFVGEVKRIFEK